MTGLLILESSGLTMIQDQGRFGWAHLGITQSGAADNWSMRIANALVGNHPNDAVLEITLGKLTLKSGIDCSIALSGAPSSIAINEVPQPLNQTLHLRSGDRLAIKPPKQGLRSYLAVSGGLVLDTQFDSYSTCLREHLGGLNGNSLESGLQLLLRAPSLQPIRQLSGAMTELYPEALTVDLVIGFQHYQLSWLEKQKLFNQRYRVLPLSDRMGLRLEGENAIPPPTDGIRSEGITLGSVQLPANGHPIIMLADHQTLGGYMKLGSICEADIGKLAQARPGTEIRFRAVSVDQAFKRTRAFRLRTPQLIDL